MTDREPAVGHPRGTLAILIAYAVLSAVGWAAVYYLVYLPRGGIHP